MWKSALKSDFSKLFFLASFPPPSSNFILYVVPWVWTEKFSRSLSLSLTRFGADELKILLVAKKKWLPINRTLTLCNHIFIIIWHNFDLKLSLLFLSLFSIWNHLRRIFYAFQSLWLNECGTFLVFSLRSCHSQERERERGEYFPGGVWFYVCVLHISHNIWEWCCEK